MKPESGFQFIRSVVEYNKPIVMLYTSTTMYQQQQKAFSDSNIQTHKQHVQSSISLRQHQ